MTSATRVRRNRSKAGAYLFRSSRRRILPTGVLGISVRNSINNLRTFPYIREREADGRLRVHGAWFDISTGELWVMDPETGDFTRPDLPPAPDGTTSGA